MALLKGILDRLLRRVVTTITETGVVADSIMITDRILIIMPVGEVEVGMEKKALMDIELVGHTPGREEGRGAMKN